MHEKIKEAHYTFSAHVDTNENHEFNIVSYAKYEAEVRLKIIEADMVRDQMPEYMWILN